jgi:phage terminase large subunit
MDKPTKVKSINGVSIVWLEECSEIKYDGYKEMLGRLRTPIGTSMHYILSCNPVGKENWVYQHFFKRTDDNGNEILILDDEQLYNKHTIIKNGTYYHHSTVDDNPFIQKAYLDRLEDIKNYDIPLYRIARWGRFGANGTRVLPQFEIATNAKKFREAINNIPRTKHYYGFDFGFEESYNAVVSMCIDEKEKILYIYDEIYLNHVTDDVMAEHPKMLQLKEKQQLFDDMNMIVADNEDPKAIRYYKQNGYKIRSCRNKFAGSRLSNTRKVKRFRKIICNPKCKNVINELKDLTYKRDAKGNIVYDEFNIDPHTFSAIWYALDTVTVADVKDEKRNTKAGAD